MTAYRFCRTDDMALLVEAHERCRGPEDAGERPLDRVGFKELVRDLDLWCSSCMVALEGREPVGVLLGAKRAQATLVHALRVHPAHRRRGHGRHLLTSLGQKLAILGPSRLVAEVPARRSGACALFEACGWRLEGMLRDWHRPASTAGGAEGATAPILLSELDAAATPAGLRPWHRDAVALAKEGDALPGLGFYSPDRLEAWLFYRGPEIFCAGFVEEEPGAAGLRLLVEELARCCAGEPLLLARAPAEELNGALLERMGFEPGEEYRRFATEARAA